MWTDEVQPEPKAEFKCDCGPMQLCVSEAASGETWQYLSLSLGRHSPRSLDECKETWPREAIALALKTLTEFEQHLRSEE